MALGLKFRNLYAKAVLLALVATLLTTVAGINISVLLLLLASPWFWKEFNFHSLDKKLVFQFFILIATLCSWDIATNVAAGAELSKSLTALQHDLRPFIFVVLLWPIFAVEKLARYALWVLIAVLVVIAGSNLVATILGFIPSGKYIWYTMHHLHGQMSVGIIFILAQMLLSRTRASWQLILPIVVLIASMLLANERRAGYFLLIAGLPLWVYLNREKFSVKQYRWWLFAVAAVLVGVAASSSIFQARVSILANEISQYISLTPEQRAGVTTSAGIRLQFYTSIWELLNMQNWWIGVGSINFGAAFAAVNYKLGTTPEHASAYFANFQNPHNEYLFMLATKGVIGLVLYVAIFIQACRIGTKKEDEVQRVGLLMFVCLFMLSITFNSMVIDMEEGHFMMLILLIFLAPKVLVITPETYEKLRN